MARDKAQQEAARRRRIEEETRLKVEAELAARQREQDAARQKAEADAAAARQATDGDKKAAEVAESGLRFTQLDRQRIQVGLTALGFDTASTNGSFSVRTRDQIAAWQKSHNYPSTGYLNGVENQALLREAAPAVSRFDDEQKRREEERARVATTATASLLGLPDAGLATYSDMVGRAEMICSVVQTPLIADADTGYGGLLNVQRTVRGYEAAGVAAIQIEDQETPKKCGHTPDRRVVPAEEMVMKIKVAADSRRDADTLIVARTDARTALGLDEALRRARLYDEAGADVIFVESPETEDELERIGREVSKPLLANMVEFGKTPRVEVDRLKKWGFDIAIYPGLGFSVAAEAMREAWSYLQAKGTSKGIEVPQYKGMHELMGFPEVWDFEKRWVS